jgi:ArsR family transcriptional regulator, arsenate/arsenite/antimonite-responsive transcriptional repressor
MSTHLAFDALADDVRRSILQVIAEKGECSAGEIADSIERVGRTTVSSHLRVLRTSGVLTERREGRHRYYSLDPEGPTRDALEFLQGLLRSSLRELSSNVEAPVPSGTERRRAAG